MTEAKQTQANINQIREMYRPVAARGALMYFIIDILNVLDRVYQYSMANFVYILKKGMDLTPGGNDGQVHVPEARRWAEPFPSGDASSRRRAHRDDVRDNLRVRRLGSLRAAQAHRRVAAHDGGAEASRARLAAG